MAKSKRLLLLIQAVYLKKVFTVGELADEFGVSYRTMLQELSELGVPLYSEQGINGGYRVLTERNIPPMHWSNVSTKQLAALGLRGKTYSKPRVVHQSHIHIIGLPFTGDYDVLLAEMPDVWRSFIGRYREIPNRVYEAVWLDVAPENHSTHTFTEYLSCIVKDFRHIPYGMVGLTIPAQKYVVFTHRGCVDEVEETYYGAFQWLEETGTSGRKTQCDFNFTMVAMYHLCTTRNARRTHLKFTFP